MRIFREFLLTLVLITLHVLSIDSDDGGNNILIAQGGVNLKIDPYNQDRLCSLDFTKINQNDETNTEIFIQIPGYVYIANISSKKIKKISMRIQYSLNNTFRNCLEEKIKVAVNSISENIINPEVVLLPANIKNTQSKNNDDIVRYQSLKKFIQYSYLEDLELIDTHLNHIQIQQGTPFIIIINSVSGDSSWSFSTKSCVLVSTTQKQYQLVNWYFYFRFLPFVGSLPHYVYLNTLTPSLKILFNDDDDNGGTGGGDKENNTNGKVPQVTNYHDCTCKDGCKTQDECGVDDCGNNCGPGCYDGNVCDESIKKCYKPLHAGSCLNPWILMQFGVDGNNKSYVPRRGDIIRTIGGQLDQTRTYPLPVTIYEKNIVGFLDDKYSLGSLYFQTSCGHKNSRLVFYIFEITQLTGLMITVKGKVRENKQPHWGKLDTVLEIRNFDKYCSPVLKSRQYSVQRKNIDWLESFQTNNGVYFNTTFSDLKSYLCNDDIDIDYGYGSRLETWLNVGRYVLIVGGYDITQTGFYDLQVNSFPSCLPMCQNRQCGVEKVCGAICGKCDTNQTCSKDGICSPPLQSPLTKSDLKPLLTDQSIDYLRSHHDKDKYIDLKVTEFKENGFTFKWVYITPTVNPFCISDKIYNTPCLSSRVDEWRLFIHLDFMIENIGNYDFVISENAIWKQSKCYSLEGKGEDKYVEGVFSIETHLIRRNIENDEIILDTVIYSMDSFFSKVPIFDKKYIGPTNTSKKKCKIPKYSKQTQGISSNYAYVSENKTPCHWYDITDHYNLLSQISKSSQKVFLKIVINVNPMKSIKERQYDNNELIFDIDASKIPKKPPY